jgi:hypothetical protein
LNRFAQHHRHQPTDDRIKSGGGRNDANAGVEPDLEDFLDDKDAEIRSLLFPHRSAKSLLLRNQDCPDIIRCTSLGQIHQLTGPAFGGVLPLDVKWSKRQHRSTYSQKDQHKSKMMICLQLMIHSFSVSQRY